jgi:hypothetical protein
VCKVWTVGVGSSGAWNLEVSSSLSDGPAGPEDDGGVDMMIGGGAPAVIGNSASGAQERRGVRLCLDHHPDGFAPSRSADLGGSALCFLEKTPHPSGEMKSTT